MSADLVSLLPTGPIRRVIVCGSRDWRTREPIYDAISALIVRYGALVKLEIIHGNQRGADIIGGSGARVYGLRETPVPVDHELDGRWPWAGHSRNARMLALGPDLVLAFKDSFDYTMRRGGTENMCRIALEAGVPVLLYSTACGWERLTQQAKPVEVLT